MTAPRPSFWHWPGWAQFGYFVLLGVAVGLWFELIYAGADYLISLHTYRVRVHFDAEPRIPFVPASVLGYMSIYLLLWSPAFILRTRRELRALAITLTAVIFVAGLCFLLLPAEAAFPPPGDLGLWSGLVRGAKLVALTNNYLPSLHITLSVACITIYARRAPPLGRTLLWLWAGVICLSTMLLHQHYLLDVVTGFVLGIAGVWLIYDRLVPPAC
jgi:membrane-associated phospholipid phosphatase